MSKQGARPGWGGGRGRYAGWFVVGAVGALSLSGCDAMMAADGPHDASYGGVCEDDRTGVRIDDRYCGDWSDDGLGYWAGGYGGYNGPTRMMWYPAQYTGDVPAVGQRVTTGAVRTVPKGTEITKGVPTQGSTAKAGGMGSVVRRGGLGVSGAKAGAGGSGAGLGKSGGS